jgi:transcriptional regulator MraZ
LFRGVSTINLDVKGRLAVPTKYRSELEDCCERQLIVTLAVNEKGSGQEGCLWLYPLPEWEIVEQTIKKLPTLSKKAGKLRQFLIGYASECEMDGHGRLLLPEKLRKFAGLEKRIVLLGLLNKFEIWNEAIWTAREAAWLDGSDDDESLEELSVLSF